jgi:hypothetical protein
LPSRCPRAVPRHRVHVPRVRRGGPVAERA